MPPTLGIARVDRRGGVCRVDNVGRVRSVHAEETSSLPVCQVRPTRQLRPFSRFVRRSESSRFLPQYPGLLLIALSSSSLFRFFRLFRATFATLPPSARALSLSLSAPFENHSADRTRFPFERSAPFGVSRGETLVGLVFFRGARTSANGDYVDGT